MRPHTKTLASPKPRSEHPPLAGLFFGARAANPIRNAREALCAPRDFQPPAHQPRTYTRRVWYARSNGFPRSGRRATACSPRPRCQTGSGRGPPVRSYIRLPEARRPRRTPERRPEPTAATMGTGNPTDLLAQAQGQEPAPALARSSPGTVRRRRSRGCGIAPETAATSGRRSFPPPGPVSIGPHKRP